MQKTSAGLRLSKSIFPFHLHVLIFAHVLTSFGPALPCWAFVDIIVCFVWPVLFCFGIHYRKLAEGFYCGSPGVNGVVCRFRAPLCSFCTIPIRRCFFLLECHLVRGSFGSIPMQRMDTENIRQRPKDASTAVVPYDLVS